jgi:hypothetical protein
MHRPVGFSRTGSCRALVALTGALVAGPLLGEVPHDGTQKLIDRMISALGGRAAIGMLRSLAVEADCTGPGGEFRTRVESLRPDAVYFRQRDGEGSTEIWSTGGRTWTRDAESGWKELDDGVRDFVRGHEFHLLVLELETRFTAHRLNHSTLEVGCRRIDMEDLAGHPASVCVRESDGLPASLEMNPPGAQGPILVRFEDWREIEGIRYFHAFVLTEGTERTFTYRYRTIEPDGVLPSRFVLPAAPDAQR